MASIQSKKLEDFNYMPKAMKDMLFKPQGNAPAQTVGQTVAKTEEPKQPQAQVAKPTVVDNTAQVQAAMAQRNQAIQAVFAPFNGQFNDLLVECLGDLNITAEQAKDKLLAKLGENTTPSVPQNHIHVGNGNLVGDSVKAALMSRAGVEETQKTTLIML
ncbi:putative Clp-like protease [Rodentibacter pneumotropicus]|uniref:Putative Clp-like protease n=1 Tax=Rodentibacter pneumotropicus TaxID=758 RepID=A0A3S4U045_9PAST|nr:putative Clp-like protease [Rodentibacter pneumotropicus]